EVLEEVARRGASALHRERRVDGGGGEGDAARADAERDPAPRVGGGERGRLPRERVTRGRVAGRGAAPVARGRRDVGLLEGREGVVAGADPDEEGVDPPVERQLARGLG